MVGVMALAACGADDSAAPQGETAGEADTPRNEGTMSVLAADYSFEAPDTIVAGDTELQFANEGKENHDLRLMQLKDGVLIISSLNACIRKGWMRRLSWARREATCPLSGQAKPLRPPWTCRKEITSSSVWKRAQTIVSRTP
jgi:hypothetical protein